MFKTCDNTTWNKKCEFSWFCNLDNIHLDPELESFSFSRLSNFSLLLLWWTCAEILTINILRWQINVYLSPEEAPAPVRAESALFSVVFVSMLNIFSITASRTLRPQPTASSSSAPATTLIEESQYFRLSNLWCQLDKLSRCKILNVAQNLETCRQKLWSRTCHTLMNCPVIGQLLAMLDCDWSITSIWT